MPTDLTIVRAAIHPAIGVARVGNSREFDGFFVGPEVLAAPALPSGDYKDQHGAIKRQAAQFRIYGYNAANEVVAEVTADNADIQWTVHLANKKAAWYEFQLALDIPEASTSAPPDSARRNKSVVGSNRSKLVIDPGPRTIQGRDQHGTAFQFTGGKFFQLDVPLGELRTDGRGHLFVLGGHGVSQSRTGANPVTFANNDDWCDDTSDGPVDAKVVINGTEIPVEGAWVIVAPPNYAPSLLTVRTMYDLLYDLMVHWGLLQAPAKVSFQSHIRPIFEGLSGLQWVNQGFASMFGAGSSFNFQDILPQLADGSSGNAAFRQNIYRHFRNPGSSQLGKDLWPMFYGDALDSLTTLVPDSSVTVRQGLASLSDLQLEWLKRWADGDFISDAAPSMLTSLADAALAEQPHMLDEASLAYCLADAFHPGCELTWPMRIQHLYSKAFRIKRRPAGSPAPDFGDVLTPAQAVSATGPLNGSVAGDLTKWMAVPWQTDTASCLSGYSFFRTGASLPTFWPARVPNDVLRAIDYKILMDTSKAVAERRTAFSRRLNWLRGFSGNDDIVRMVTEFHKLGIVEEQPGPDDLPGIPSRVWVESRPALPEPAATGITETVGAEDQHMKSAGRKLRQPGCYGLSPE